MARKAETEKGVVEAQNRGTNRKEIHVSLLMLKTGILGVVELARL